MLGADIVRVHDVRAHMEAARVAEAVRGTNEMTDRIHVDRIAVFAYHGLHAEEAKLGQRFFILARRGASTPVTPALRTTSRARSPTSTSRRSPWTSRPTGASTSSRRWPRRSPARFSPAFRPSKHPGQGGQAGGAGSRRDRRPSRWRSSGGVDERTAASPPYNLQRRARAFLGLGGIIGDVRATIRAALDELTAARRQGGRAVLGL